MSGLAQRIAERVQYLARSRPKRRRDDSEQSEESVSKRHRASDDSSVNDGENVMDGPDVDVAPDQLREQLAALTAPPRPSVTRTVFGVDVGDDDIDNPHTSLDKMYVAQRDTQYRAAQEELASRPKIYCFLCEFGNVSQDGSDPDGCAGFADICNYITNNIPYRDIFALAREAVVIYNQQIRDPALRANGGTLPPNVPHLFAEDVVTHITDHVRHPIVTKMFCLDTLRKLATVTCSQITMERTLDVKAATLLVQTIGKIDTINDSIMKYARSDPDIVLDPAKMFAVANTKRLEKLIERDRDAIGGAGAFGSANSVTARAEAARPAFGATRLQIHGDLAREPDTFCDETDG